MERFQMSGKINSGANTQKRKYTRVQTVAFTSHLGFGQSLNDGVDGTINPLNASCSKFLLFEEFSAILV